MSATNSNFPKPSVCQTCTSEETAHAHQYVPSASSTKPIS